MKAYEEARDTLKSTGIFAGNLGWEAASPGMEKAHDTPVPKQGVSAPAEAQVHAKKAVTENRQALAESNKAIMEANREKLKEKLATSLGPRINEYFAEANKSPALKQYAEPMKTSFDQAVQECTKEPGQFNAKSCGDLINKADDTVFAYFTAVRTM